MVIADGSDWPAPLKSLNQFFDVLVLLVSLMVMANVSVDLPDQNCVLMVMEMDWPLVPQTMHSLDWPAIDWPIVFPGWTQRFAESKSSVTPWYQHRTGHFHGVACQDWPIWLSNQSPLHAAAGFLTTFVMRVNIMSFTVISVIICYLGHILSFLIITVGWGMFRTFRYVRCVMVVGLYADSSDSIQLDLQFPCGLSLKFCFMIFHDSWFVTQG